MAIAFIIILLILNVALHEIAHGIAMIHYGIKPLDVGRIFKEILQKIFGKRSSVPFTSISLMILLGLIIFVFVGDINRLF